MGDLNKLTEITPGMHLRSSDLHGGRAVMLKAHLRKPEDQLRIEAGRLVGRIKELSGLTLKEFTVALGKNDERQVARWMSGAEPPQLHAILGAEELRQPLVVAVAEAAGAGVDIQTTVTIRRSA